MHLSVISLTHSAPLLVQPPLRRPRGDDVLAIRQDIDPLAEAIDSDGVDGRRFRSLFDLLGVAGFDIANHVGELSRVEDDAVSTPELPMKMPMFFWDGSA